MAEVAALRQALVRLGFTNEAATYITTDQGIDSLEQLRYLTDEECTNLCKVTRRPGGTIDNPEADDAGPALIPNPGTQVSLRAENNLKLAAYMLRYYERVSRTATPQMITQANVQQFRSLKIQEKLHEDVDPPELSEKDWPKNMDALNEYFRGCLGVTNIPLAYCLRDNIDVPPEGNDPSTNYPTQQDELIARAPIQEVRNGVTQFTPTYLTDNAKTWDLLSKITRGLNCWTYVKSAQRTRDGRAGFQSLYNHFVGANRVDNMSTIAENKLQNTTYTGEKRRFNFERYVQIHVDQHNILDGLVRYGYSGIDERSKVRYLLNGIKTTALDSVKTRILSDSNLRSNFDACVTLFQDMLTQTKESNDSLRSVTIASVKTKHGTKRKWSDVTPDMSVEDRYYKKQEYQKLSPEKKKGLKLKRSKRTKPRNSQASATETTPVNNETPANEQNNTNEVVNNRNNPALQRNRD